MEGSVEDDMLFFLLGTFLLYQPLAPTSEEYAPTVVAGSKLTKEWRDQPRD